MSKTSNRVSFLSFLPLMFIFGIIVVNFQNCSSMSSANFDSGDGVVSEGESGAILTTNGGGGVGSGTTTTVISAGITKTFEVDEVYTGDTLVEENSFLDTLIQKVNYSSYGKAKAIAVSESGLGFVTILDDESFNEAEALALESCNLISGQSCAVIVSGNKFIVSSDSIIANSQYVLNGFKGQVFSKNKMPLVPSFVRDGLTISGFEDAKENKALALSVTGGVYATFTSNIDLNTEEASRMALEQCELEAAITPCILYAVNDSVVFDPKAWVKKMKIDFDNNNVKAKGPPASRDTSVSSIGDFIDAVGSIKKYAIYITPNGYGYFADGATKDEAKNLAVQRCEAGIHGTRCIEYATSAGVTITSDALVSKKDFADLYCKVPRYSCSDHIKAGCTIGGAYWVQNSQTLESEMVNCAN